MITWFRLGIGFGIASATLGACLLDGYLLVMGTMSVVGSIIGLWIFEQWKNP